MCMLQILFTIFVIILMSMLPHDSPGFIFWGCLLAFSLVLLCIRFYGSRAGKFCATRMHEVIDVMHESGESRFVVTESAWAGREHYRQDTQALTPFGTRARIATWAMRALPPVKSFRGDETTQCPICMDEFKNGELIQSFGLCAHEFHSSCLNSWLLGGKTTCPICRKDLLTITCIARDTSVENRSQLPSMDPPSQ